MSIFRNACNSNSTLVSLDAEWSPRHIQELRALFTDRGFFKIEYDGTTDHFIKHFKEDLKEFYEKVLRDYDECVGRGSYEDCFYTMIEDFKIINCQYWMHATDVDSSEDY